MDVPVEEIPGIPKRLLFFNLTLDKPLSGRYISLVGTDFYVCELEAYTKVSQTCPAGSYGRSCQHKCGHCLNRTPCEPETGQCVQCDPGYTGETCTKECQDGKFGTFCTGICRCKNKEKCNHVTGTCPGDKCPFGFGGRNCNISLNRARGKIVTVSHVDTDWPAEHAVDGLYFNQTRDFCAIAQRWMRVDLGVEYEVSTVIVHGSIQGQNTQIFIFTTESDRNQLPTKGDTLYYSHTLVSPVKARYVKLRSYFDVICEIEVFGDCPAGTFGSLCENNCSRKCNGVCDNVDGVCTGGCVIGWQGDFCEKRCISPSFGQDCAGTCHCKGGGYCNNVDGKCYAGMCNPGWKGQSCNAECTSPTFGQNCSNICHCVYGSPCDHVNGVCVLGLCDPGWRGQACDKECPNGAYGIACKNKCSKTCRGNCDKVNGQCTHGCIAGWQGDKCNTECSTPTFGPSCSRICHCINDSHCDHIDGVCDLDLCDPGWQGPACDQECNDGFYGYNCEANCSRNCNGSCDKVNGHCKNGCDIGWQGDMCTEAKPDLRQTRDINVTVIYAPIITVLAAALVIVMVFVLKTRIRNMSNNEDRAPEAREMVGMTAHPQIVPGSTDGAAYNVYQELKLDNSNHPEGVYTQIDTYHVEPVCSGPVREPVYVNTTFK